MSPKTSTSSSTTSRKNGSTPTTNTTSSTSATPCIPFKTLKPSSAGPSGTQLPPPSASTPYYVTLLTYAASHLKPGGYFEVQEIAWVPQSDDDTLHPSTPYALRDYLAYMEGGLRALGSEMYAVHALADELAAAGFADVRKTTHKCPLGVWPRDKRLRCCGLFLRTVLMDGLRGLSRRPLMALGWTQLQIEMFLVEVRKAVMDEGVHSYVTLHVVHGRKPES